MFSRRNINRNRINNIMKQGLKDKNSFIRGRREEAYDNLISELKSKPTFDRSLLGSEQKKKPVRRKKQSIYQKRMTLKEQQDRELQNELDEIIRELEDI